MMRVMLSRPPTETEKGTMVLATCGMLLWLSVASRCVARTTEPTDQVPGQDIILVVMDPLSLPLSCLCVPGFGQRNYQPLADRVAAALGRRVNLVFDDGLALAAPRTGGRADIIIGKEAVVELDARTAKISVRKIAKLSGLDGSTGTRGLFVVRRDDPAKSLADVIGRRIVIGPDEDREPSEVALATLRAVSGEQKFEYRQESSIDNAVFAVADGEADVSIMPDYMPALMEGCGKIDKGSLRVIGKTEPVPFIAVYVSDAIDPEQEKAIRSVLADLTASPERRAELESKLGFIQVWPQVQSASPQDWPDFRGPRRDGRVAELPDTLPAKPKILWRQGLTGAAIGGPVVSRGVLVIPDKTVDSSHDLWRAFDVQSGKALWEFRHPAAGGLDYSNSPRATPVIQDDRVYLLGAFGNLHCVGLADGRLIWQKSYVTDFDGVLPTWGFCAAPLVVGEKLIVNPGGEKASIVALNRESGEVIWSTPGNGAAYAAYVLSGSGSRSQVVGFDVLGLAGWDVQTGKRLWEACRLPSQDFNVGTPVIVGQTVIVATENNGALRYRLPPAGVREIEPVASHFELAPDSSTPLVVKDRLFCNAYGELFCLDVANGLEAVWVQEDDMFADHCNFIGSDDRVLIWTMSGDLLLLPADCDRYQVISHMRPFAGSAGDESLAPPALAGNVLFLRGQRELVALQLNR